MNRRNFIKKSGLLAVGLALSSFVQTAVAATRDAFSKKEMKEALQSVFGKSDYQESDAVDFKTPEIAENGAVVPVTVDYDGKVKKIAIFVEENPQPMTAAFDVPERGTAYVSTRIKMGKSSDVHAVVQTADGQLIGAKKLVKVTIGGCGG